MSATKSRVSPPRKTPSTVVVGRIGRPHGIRGVLTVESLSDVEDRFSPGRTLLVQSAEDMPPAGRLTVETVGWHKDRLLVTFSEIDDRDQALELRGSWLTVPREEVPAAEEGSYYYFELIGCRVVDRASGEIGTVVDLLEDGGGLLLEVEGPQIDGHRTGGREVREKSESEPTVRYLVPFVAALVPCVDTENGRITTALPPGLLETCVSTS